MKVFIETTALTWLCMMVVWIGAMTISGAGFLGGSTITGYSMIAGVASIVVGAAAQIDAWIEAIRELSPGYLRVKKYNEAKTLLELGKNCRVREDRKWFGRDYSEAEQLEMNGKFALLDSATLGYEPAIILARSMNLTLLR